MDFLKNGLNYLKDKTKVINDTYREVMKVQKKNIDIIKKKTYNASLLTNNIENNKYFNEQIVMLTILYQREPKKYTEIFTKAYNILTILNMNGMSFYFPVHMMKALEYHQGKLETEEEVESFLNAYVNERTTAAGTYS